MDFTDSAHCAFVGSHPTQVKTTELLLSLTNHLVEKWELAKSESILTLNK